MAQQVKVGILGQEYVLYTRADKAYVEKVARYVSSRCAEAQNALRSSSKATILALAALNIASEYLQVKESHEALLERIEHKDEMLAALVL